MDARPGQRKETREGASFEGGWPYSEWAPRNNIIGPGVPFPAVAFFLHTLRYLLTKQPSITS